MIISGDAIKYEDLKHLMWEQCKAHYMVVTFILSSMSKDEYDKIPILELTKDQIDLINNYAMRDIDSYQSEAYLAGKPYYDLYYVSPTLFKVYNENN
jgi:hypothetical protein